MYVLSRTIFGRLVNMGASDECVNTAVSCEQSQNSCITNEDSAMGVSEAELTVRFVMKFQFI